MSESRRKFLRCAPAAVAAGVVLADRAASAAEAAGTFQVFRAVALHEDALALGAAPGNKSLVTEKSFTVVMTVEKAKSAKEFEWHEGRDHVLQVLDGETSYEIGGKPRDGRTTKPGEWLAPASEGAETVALKQGDMLSVPRGTPHKRTTTGSVTFLLISAQG